MLKLGLRTEIIVHIVFLLAAALLFVSLILLKLAEKEVLNVRIAGAEQLMEALGRASGDRASMGALGYSLAPLGKTGLEGIAAVDDEMQVLVSESTEDGFLLNTPELQKVNQFHRPSAQVRYDMAWWPFAQDKPRFIYVTVPVFSEGKFAGALQARFSLEDIRQRLLFGQKIVLLLISFYGLLLVAAGIYLLSRNVVRPVRVLAGATRQVAAGNYEQTITVQGPAEIMDLAENFNEMLEALHQSRKTTESTIASLRKANEETRSVEDELVRSERLASVGHLAAGMAHEIGNPLGAIVGYLELLKSELVTMKERDLAERALKELGRIDRLVRDLLDYAAPGEGAPEPADPGQVMFEAEHLLDQQGAFDSIRTENQLPRSLPTVRINRHKLLQVFVNLLLNARDASPEGGTVCLAGGSEADEVWLEVADKGYGMDDEQLLHIFDPFYSTKTPGRGRGLGLSVSHRIVKEAGGRIDVTSQPGAGSKFIVRLPVAAGERQ